MAVMGVLDAFSSPLVFDLEFLGEGVCMETLSACAEHYWIRACCCELVTHGKAQFTHCKGLAVSNH
jgi:hypothetical protein